MVYTLIKKILFQLEPETAHSITFQSLKLANKLGLLSLLPKVPASPRHIMGLQFPNPVGLAAGLDKNGECIDALAALGFGFIEVGTVTPKPQDGNPRPRLFRLPEHEAIINRLGFNNKGCDYLVEQLKKTKYKGILGINIGKNKTTPIESAIEDYLIAYRAVVPYASYITVNVSSPNTEGLRDLQHGELLRSLLHALKLEQAQFSQTKNKYVPLVVKIAPDLTEAELKNIAEILLSEKVDGVIATNTTISRVGVENSAVAKETGGLSGKPLMVGSTKIVKQLYEMLHNKIPIIAVGGISGVQDAKEKLMAGASLLQVYTGFIYQGPTLINEIAGSL